MGLLILGALYAPLLKAAASVPRPARGRGARWRPKRPRCGNSPPRSTAPSGGTGGSARWSARTSFPTRSRWPIRFRWRRRSARRLPGVRTALETGPSLPSHWPLEAARLHHARDRGRRRHRRGTHRVGHRRHHRHAGAGRRRRERVPRSGATRSTGSSSCSRIRTGYQTKYGHLSRALVSPGSAGRRRRSDRTLRQLRAIDRPPPASRDPPGRRDDRSPHDGEGGLPVMAIFQAPRATPKPTRCAGAPTTRPSRSSPRT